MAKRFKNGPFTTPDQLIIKGKKGKPNRSTSSLLNSWLTITNTGSIPLGLITCRLHNAHSIPSPSSEEDRHVLMIAAQPQGKQPRTRVVDVSQISLGLDPV